MNNFWTERDMQKVSTDHLHKFGIAEWIDDVTSGLTCPLVAKTTFLFYSCHMALSEAFYLEVFFTLLLV
jgi:hypothetical protein